MNKGAKKSTNDACKIKQFDLTVNVKKKFRHRQAINDGEHKTQKGNKAKSKVETN